MYFSMKNTILIATLITSGLFSGFLTHSSQQLALFIHLFATAILAIVCFNETRKHTIDKQKTPNLPMLLTGSAAALLVIICYASAIINIVIMSSNNSTLLQLIHQFSSYILIAFLLIHLWKKSNYIKNEVQSITLKNKHTVFAALLISLGLITGYTLISINEASYSVDDYSYTYGENPFSPSLTVTRNQQFAHPNYFDNSSCIGCHNGIAKQWSSSAHRHAAADPFYVKNIELLAKLKGIEATRYCEGCHAPGALLTGSLTPGGSHGGQKENIANDIGVDCVTCHSIDSSTNDEGNANYIITEKRLGLSTFFNNKPLDTLSIVSISLSPDSHVDMMKSDFSRTSRYCSTCHSQFMDETMNDWGWVKMQDEYQAWLDSSFSHSNDPAFSKDSVLTCQNCHMPLIKADDPAANSDGLVASHKFLGANTALPFLRDDEPHLRDTIEFLSANKISMSFDIQNRKKATENIIHANRTSKSHKIKPIYFYNGETLEANLIISNHGVGHNFPGGTLDLNEAWVEIKITDANGKILHKEGGIDNKGHLSATSYAYKSIPVDPNGNPVWKHDLFNKTGEAYKNIIKPGESDSIKISTYIPQYAESPLILTAKLRFRKMNKKYSNWALGNQALKLPIVDIAHTELTVDLVLRQPTVE